MKWLENEVSLKEKRRHLKQIIKFKPLILAMQADSICIYIIKWGKITVHLHGLPSTRKSTAPGICQEEFLHMHRSHIVICHWVISSMESVWGSQATRLDLLFSPTSLQGKKELGYLPETSSSFLRIVVGAFSKQPYFYVCIEIERRKKSYFQKISSDKRDNYGVSLFDSSFPEKNPIT